MDDRDSRENSRRKPDQYRAMNHQWMIPQHQMKDNHAAQAVKLMAIMAERDSALNERDLALSEKKAALAERDMALFQRDAAIAERNNAIIERDNAIAALDYSRENGITPGRNTPHGQRNVNHHSHHHTPSPLDSPYNNHGRDLDTSDAVLTSANSDGVGKSGQKKRQRKEPKPKDLSSPRTSKSPRKKSMRANGAGEDLNMQVTVADIHGEWRAQSHSPTPLSTKHRKEWKAEDLGGLNEVVFDESSMPVPVCSCTGKYQPCYKWGSGGWQSACCTTTISMYPLPVMPNKRHARVNGRKMSGTVFTKLLSRLASEGHDLRVPVDLKDHWSKHGTNRYITIK